MRVSGFDFAGGSSGSALFDASGSLVGGPLSAGSGCDSYFEPLATIREALANPPEPSQPMDVMVVLDRSGSMAAPAPPTGRSKLEEARDAAALFIQLVRGGLGDRLGLVTFGSTATLRVPLTAVTAAQPLLVGAPPFAGGAIGEISARGATSLGAGVGLALDAFTSTPPTEPSNLRAILLLTDGLQNTAPLIQDVEPSLGATKLFIVGFGADADIDGALLSRLANEHGGDFTRALDGLALRKAFALCYGNLLEAGTLLDPDHRLRASDSESRAHPFPVCEETAFTVVVGWESPASPLRISWTTPSGRTLTDKQLRTVRGRTWLFQRVPLPFQGERAGEWSLIVRRLTQTRPPSSLPAEQRYFILILPTGGPRLMPMARQRRLYTGDPVDPLVALRNTNRTAPKGRIQLSIEAPEGRPRRDGDHPARSPGHAIGAGSP